MTLDDCRRFYAQEIRFSAGLNSAPLVDAFARVPRENFLGPPPWRIGMPDQRALSLAGMAQMLYLEASDPRDLCHNVVVALDISRNINNGQPGALARWIEAMELKPGDRAFHLGCGVGYYTAIMAEVVGPGGSVAGSEFQADLASRAKENLTAYPNVTVHAGDGAAFDPGECDAMFINAGVTHPHPMWLDRLREGGRLVLPITIPAGTSGIGQGVVVRIRRERDAFSAQTLTVAAIYSCTSVRDSELEPLIRKGLTTGAILKLKSVRRDRHEQADTCIVHARDVCLSSAEVGLREAAPASSS